MGWIVVTTHLAHRFVGRTLVQYHIIESSSAQILTLVGCVTCDMYSPTLSPSTIDRQVPFHGSLRLPLKNLYIALTDRLSGFNVDGGPRTMVGNNTVTLERSVRIELYHAKSHPEGIRAIQLTLKSSLSVFTHSHTASSVSFLLEQYHIYGDLFSRATWGVISFHISFV